MKAQAIFFQIVSLALFSLTLVSCGKEKFPPSANFTINTATETNITTVYINEPLSFSNTSELAETQEWDFGDSTTSALVSPTHAYKTAGTYTVSLTVTNGDGTDTYTSFVNVKASIYPGERVETTYVGNTFSTLVNKNGSNYRHEKGYDIWANLWIHIIYFDDLGLAYGFVNESSNLSSSDACIAIFVSDPFSGATEEGIEVGSTKVEVENVFGTALVSSTGLHKYDDLGIGFRYEGSPNTVLYMMLYEVDGLQGGFDTDQLITAYKNDQL